MYIQDVGQTIIVYWSYRVVWNFRGRSISLILDFSSFAGTNFRKFGFENNFSRISCVVLESSKDRSHIVAFVTLFATNFNISMNFSNVNKRSKFSRIYSFGGSLFSRDSNFADRWKICEIRENQILRKFHATWWYLIGLSKFHSSVKFCISSSFHTGQMSSI